MTHLAKPQHRLFAGAALTLLGAGIAASSAWNRIAADLGGLPEATYANGLAAAVAVFLLAAAAGFGLRMSAAASKG